MTDVTPNAPKEMAVWLGSELAGHLDQKAWPVESFDSQMTPLEESIAVGESITDTNVMKAVVEVLLGGNTKSQ